MNSDDRKLIETRVAELKAKIAAFSAHPKSTEHSIVDICRFEGSVNALEWILTFDFPEVA